MPRRRVMELAAIAAGLLLAAGCRGRVESPASPPPTAPDRATLTDAGSGTATGSGTVPPQVEAAPSLPVKPAVRISPEAFTITADDPGLQLLAVDEAEPARDRTAQVAWSAEPAGLVAIEPGGYLRPIGAGAGVVTVKAALPGASNAPAAEAKVTIAARASRSWDFGEDIVPILTRMGCNTGSCHGRLEGQNGFHLSLFGYDPAGDYKAVVRDAGQRGSRRCRPVTASSWSRRAAAPRTSAGGG